MFDIYVESVNCTWISHAHAQNHVYAKQLYYSIDTLYIAVS